MYLYFSIGNGQAKEPALRQLYRHTFVPYSHYRLAVGDWRMASKSPSDIGNVVGIQGSFPVRKRTGTLRIWRAREREPIRGLGAVPP